MRTLLLVGLLAAVLATDSLFLGWWTVPAFGLVVGLLAARRPVVIAGAATLLAWGGLLLWSTLAAPAETRALTERLGTLIPVGRIGLYALTLLLGLLLAAVAAALGAALRALATRDARTAAREADAPIAGVSAPSSVSAA